MGSAWAQALWLLVLWALLPPVTCDHSPPGWRFTSSEVVIPKKVPLRMGGSKMPEQLAYRVRFRGQRHVIHMKLKKNMVPRHFPVFTDDDQGAMQEDYPYVPQDCYYYSFLEGVPGSVATLDTCTGGLRGMLQVDDFTYEIKPLEASSKFEHVISLLSDDRAKGSEKCGIEEGAMDQLLEETKLAETPRAGPPYLWRVHMRNVKILYSVSNQLHNAESNRTRLVEMIMIINSITDSIYEQAGFDAMVYAVFVWTRRDHVDLSRHAGKVTEDYGLYNLNNVFQYLQYSVGVYLTKVRLTNLPYYAFHDGLCNPNWGAIYLSLANYHLFLSGTFLAHALGHSFGAPHDSSGCVCFRRTNCVMTPAPGMNDMLSNCTYRSIHARAFGWDTCMSNRLRAHTNYPYISNRCGDGIIDQNETCDCGSFKQCASQKCCGTDCHLSLGSECHSGGCCYNCKITSPGVICRDKLGICDLREYCDGTSGNCPTDRHILDGTPCSTQAVCIKGNCSDRNLQCQALFGYQVKDASPTCYKELNKRGDPYGNCGLRFGRGGTRNIRCEDDHVFCGMLHCDNVYSIPGGGEHTTFHHIKVHDVKEVQCFGYDAHYGTELPEMGLVVDGATCGPGKFCRAQNCTFHQDMGYECDIQRCNFRGVCNDNQKCHCVRGWSPPFCDQRGVGGSEDSGPPPKDVVALRAKIHPYTNPVVILAIGRFVVFVLSILCGGLVKAKMVIQAKLKR